MTRIVILGGGPAGYEAALVAAQHEASVVLVEEDSVGGYCVAYDCVPSKTFIASAGVRAGFRRNADMGIEVDEDEAVVDLPRVNGRVKGLALAQSSDIKATIQRAGVRVVDGRGRFRAASENSATHDIEIAPSHGGEPETVTADVVLIATGASPRVLPDAVPDGRRILTWRQLYDLEELPEHLVVVGSGVTGAEFVSAYAELGVPVTLISSRDRVLPHEDPDAAATLEEVFTERGVTIEPRSRADKVVATADGVRVTLSDGREVTGSHALMTVGSIPNTADLGCDEVGLELRESGHITVDRVSRTSVPGVYAAGDCTGLLPLASVAAMQGRIAMWHALGEGVSPLRLKTVASAVFTRPEVATVGIGHKQVESGEFAAREVLLPLGTNPRAKMQGLDRGFVKIFCRPATGVVIGGVIVAPVASELVLPLAMAVQNNLTVDDLAHTFSIYPSLSGSVTEAGRRLMQHDDLD
ncbi:NAD(P)H-quinone dehydrogenase [Actinomycetospora sp. NBRC 106378]|uniref:NAD(P)H-quinone dehydrogenase n=1 Tax=Actinomycetospora sp. NBRC 106378 TaxID=3032208 RepID=UPI0024A45BFD|nr:NAD(P)H-quinone dehydrogenase [Actinomycetospora sp. NBRC 106378]GLZ55359.1 dihydrolipoamide dehydrogenase [Actinomycetospora sp. NBRC 106378]